MPGNAKAPVEEWIENLSLLRQENWTFQEMYGKSKQVTTARFCFFNKGRVNIQPAHENSGSTLGVYD